MGRLIVAVVASVLGGILLLPVYAVVGLVLVFAWCVRAIGRLLEPRFVPWTELIAFDPTLGWKPRPHLDAHYLADCDDVFRVVTDKDGWTGHRSVEQSEVVVVGDSFAFGYGVDTNRCFAEVDPALRTKAVGAPGYSMVHGVLLMEQFGSRLKGKLVVWFVYPENDLQDNIAPAMRRYRAPFIRPTRAAAHGWEIVREHVRPSAWECSNLGRQRLFPTFCVPGPRADRAYAACDYLIARAQRACAQAGAQLALITIPHPMQLTEVGRSKLAELSGRPAACDDQLPDRRIAECCRTHGVAMVAGRDRLCGADYKRREGIHWNERGHRRMARVVGELRASFQSGTLDKWRVPAFADNTTAESRLPVDSPLALR